MVQDPKLLRPILASAAPPDLEVTFRPMFGGFFAYADGKPFASLSDLGLALSFVGSERDATLALPGAAPLRYEPDQPASKSYVVLPGPMLSEPDELRSWVIRSVSSLTAKRVRKRA
jgi:TfoX/Sxy family transcriptional regulator of competence genes